MDREVRNSASLTIVENIRTGRTINENRRIDSLLDVFNKSNWGWGCHCRNNKTIWLLLGFGRRPLNSTTCENEKGTSQLVALLGKYHFLTQKLASGSFLLHVMNTKNWIIMTFQIRFYNRLCSSHRKMKSTFVIVWRKQAE